MLDNIFIRAFLLLALYSSRVIMCSLTSLVVEGRVYLSLQLPYDTGIFHVAKSLPSFACHPSSLFNILVMKAASNINVASWCVM